MTTSPVRSRESGMVTAEIAIGLIGVLLVLVISLTAVMTGVDHVRCAEASRVGARLAARAEPDARVLQGALEVAPAGSRVTLSRSGGSVTVTVRAPRRPVFAAVGFDIAAVADSVAPREVPHA